MILPSGTVVEVEGGSAVQSVDADIFGGQLVGNTKFILSQDYEMEGNRIVADFKCKPIAAFVVSGTTVDNVALEVLVHKESNILSAVTPGSPSNVPFISSEYAGVPVWGWALIAIGGIGAIYLLTRD